MRALALIAKNQQSVIDDLHEALDNLWSELHPDQVRENELVQAQTQALLERLASEG